MDMTAEKHNRVRRLILQALVPEHPNPVDAVILRRCLANLGYAMDARDLDSYLAYLRERGYVRLGERKGFDITLVTITADGLDVVDDRLHDRGVGVEI